MRVAILHDWLVTWRGGELCLDEVTKIFEQVEIFTMFHSSELTNDKLKSFKIHSSKIGKMNFIIRRHRMFIPFVPLFVWYMSKQLEKRHKENPFDVVLSISHCGVKNVKIPKGVKHICYCLTPVRYVWDQFDNYVKNIWLRAALGIPRYLTKIWDVRGSKNVDVFASISQFVINRVNSYYGRESELIYPPVNLSEKEKSEKADTNEPVRAHFLVVNAAVPYKNTMLAVRACRDLNLPLKIVGIGPELGALKKVAGPKTEFLGNVSNQELVSLYKGARALIFCAEEDFGIVPLEANSYGLPVIFYGSGGLKETQVEGAKWTGVSFNRPDTESLKEAIVKFQEIENSIDESYCKENAKRFSVDLFHRNIKNLILSNVKA